MTQTQKYIDYAKYNWLCNGIELLNLQKVEWYPFEHDEFTYPIEIFALDNHDGKVYVKEPEGTKVASVAEIVKGTVKYIIHTNEDNERLIDNIGTHDLRIHAFVIMHFKKFNGSVKFTSKGSVITQIEIQ